MTAPRPVTTDEAARLLNVPPARIRAWKHRGLIVPVGLLPGRGKYVPVFDLEDIKPLAGRYQAQKSPLSSATGQREC